MKGGIQKTQIIPNNTKLRQTCVNLKTLQKCQKVNCSKFKSDFAQLDTKPRQSHLVSTSV